MPEGNHVASGTNVDSDSQMYWLVSGYERLKVTISMASQKKLKVLSKLLFHKKHSIFGKQPVKLM